MRTPAPHILPLFRSQMQLEMLALLLLQPERAWTLHELTQALGASQSSVHRELGRAEAAGVVRREASTRPHRFQAATDDAFYEPLAALLGRSVGIESRLRDTLDETGVEAAVIHGSWAAGGRAPDSDIDVLVVGDVELRDLRRRVRPLAKAAGRTIDLTVLSREEFAEMTERGSSFSRRLREAPITPLVGDLFGGAHP